MKSDHKVHQYERVDIGKHGKEYFVLKCILPNCSHYLPHPELGVGRLSLCHGGCGNAVEITKLHLTEKIKKPMCEQCRKERKQRRELLRMVE